MIDKIRGAHLIIIRGPAGSGKSTLANILWKALGNSPCVSEVTRVEADDYFYDADDYYCFDGTRIHAAHAWCKRVAAEQLFAKGVAIVSNTCIQIRHLEQYIEMAEVFDAHISVYECCNSFTSVHAPEEVADRMRKQMEPLAHSRRMRDRIEHHNKMVASLRHDEEGSTLDQVAGFNRKMKWHLDQYRDAEAKAEARLSGTSLFVTHEGDNP
jgi:predicted kinase